MIEITKRPILILATPRTGSTALGVLIKTQCNDMTIPYFIEPDYDGLEKIQTFIDFSKTSKNFIVKIQALNLHRYGEEISTYLLKSDDVYRIRITRRNLVDQIASFYIAMFRNKEWHFRAANNRAINDVIPIDINKLILRTKQIAEYNDCLNKIDTVFDSELVYEDLPNMDDTGLYRTPLPLNQVEIIAAVTQTLRDFGTNGGKIGRAHV